MTFPRPAFARFGELYVPEPNTGCWLWLGATNVRGYGLFYSGVGRVNVYAHRWIFERTVGPILEGWYCCHRCDTPSCVNPDHLFAGTPTDNVRDMRAKGRQNYTGRRPSIDSKRAARVRFPDLGPRVRGVIA